MNATTPSPHTVVVGGGLAGLATATYLARGGATVTLIEKAPTLGGRAATDTPRGFTLNRGAHALYTGGAASSVLRDLGVTYQSGTPRGYLARDADGRLHAFPATALDLLRTRLLDAADKAEMLRAGAQLATLQPATVAHTTTADFLAASVRRPKVRSLLESLARVSLYTAALDIASADVFVARFQQSTKHPVHYVEGGWQTLVAGLSQAARTAGVHILSSAGVAHLQVQDGQARSVVLNDGRMLAATEVVCATPPEDALRLLPETGAPRLRSTLAELVPIRVACLDLALEHLPMPRQAVVFDLPEPRFVTAQSEFAHLAPTGGAVVHTFFHLHPHSVGDPQHERASLEALLDEVQPGWRPLALESRFLPRMLAAGALPLAATGGLRGRPALRCEEIPNLYFAGDWVGPEGFLLDGSLASARAVARLISTASRARRLRAAA